MKLEVGLDVCIVVSTEFCKFVSTKFTSPIRLFFFSFSPFHSFKVAQNENTFPENVVIFFAQIIIYHMLITGSKKLCGVFG